jgi:hypothetical protein
VISLVVFGLAVALLVAHLLDRAVPRGYVLAAFIMSAIVAAGDLKEPAGQTCVTTAATVTTKGPLGGSAAVTETYPVETCTTQYAVKVESLAALVASIIFAVLVLTFEVLDRLAATGGWTV